MPSHCIPPKTDVLIVGAGPAGSSLAYLLAQAGLDVLLIDKARFPRAKTCAGGVNFRTRRLFPFDIQPVTEATITGITFTRHLRDAYTRRDPEPFMVTVHRQSFDHFLVEQARRVGAHFRDGVQFRGMAPKNDAVEVETSSGTCLTKFLVGADGAQSPVARALGLRPVIFHILVIHTDAPASIFPTLELDTIQIDWGSLKRSYAYLFPKRSVLSIGAGGARVTPSAIKKYQRAFLETRWQKEGTLPVSVAGHRLPLRQRRQPIQKGRCLLLGDAAGLVDPFTGEGIYSAVRSAQAAAAVLPDALQGGDGLPYQEAIDRDLMPELECAWFIRELFNLRPSYFHKKFATNDRWWMALTKILRGERTFRDVKRRLGLAGKILHAWAK